MILTGFARLGADAEMRQLPNGDPVATLSLAFSHGRRTRSGTQTQWIQASLWGRRAEALAHHLVKGTAVDVVIHDPHIETWQKKDGTTGTKLAGTVLEIEFAGKGDKQEGGASLHETNHATAHSADPFDDDIPF